MLNYGVNIDWEHSSRGFWTKRKKTATSLITVLSLLTGMAAAFKLFDQSVPNNVVRDASAFDYEVFKKDAAVPDGDFVQTGSTTPIFQANDASGGPIDTFPGDTRTVDVRLDNTNQSPERDATFFVYVDQDAYKVTGCFTSGGSPVAVGEDGNCEEGATTTSPTDVPATGTTATIHNRFVAFWTLTIDKEKVLGANDGQAELNEDDHTGQNLLQPEGDADGYPDESGNRQYAEACHGSLKEIRDSNPCNLGNVRGFGTRDAAGERLDVRYYLFGLTEADTGADQSPYRGWTLQFDLVFQARVPALPEVTAVYER